jgi:hypothetical protein
LAVSEMSERAPGVRADVPELPCTVPARVHSVAMANRMRVLTRRGVELPKQLLPSARSADGPDDHGDIMTREARLIGECRTALKIAIGGLRGLNDVLPTATASETIGELQAVVDKIDAWSYSGLETRRDQRCLCTPINEPQAHGMQVHSDCPLHGYLLVRNDSGSG